MSCWPEDFRLSVISAIELSGLPMPRGETVYTIAGRLLDITPGECKRLRLIGGTLHNQPLVRAGYWMLSYALEKRGHLRGLTTFSRALADVECEPWIDWLADNGNYHILEDMWYSSHKYPPGPDGKELMLDG